MPYPEASELIDQVRNAIGEPETDYYTDPQIASWLDDGQRYIAVHTVDESLADLLVDYTIVTVAGNEMYPLPGNFLRMRSVEVDSRAARVVPIASLPQYEKNKLWKGSYMFPIVYLPGGFKLGVKPRPATTPAINLRYVAIPTSIYSGVTPKLPEPMYIACTFYAAARAKEKEAAWNEAAVFQERCDRFIAAANGARGGRQQNQGG